MDKFNQQFLLEDIYDQIMSINDKKADQGLKISAQRFSPFDIPGSNITMSDDAYRFYNNKTINTKCVDCNIELVKFDETSYTCTNCGVIEGIVGDEIETNNNADGVSSYNTSDSSGNQIKISGPNSYHFQRKFITNTSNYKKTQKKNTIIQMLNVIFQYTGSAPPKNVVMQAAEYYYEVQQHCIKRGEVRKGTMAACLYRKCIENQITRKPKEIADIFGIAQSELSNGCKILDDLEAKGLLIVKSVEQEELTEMNSFLDRYFSILGIPIDDAGYNPVVRPNYKEFGMKLIKFTQKYRIAISSIMSSKCAGAVYILSRCKELNVKRDDIERECSISKSTFSRYSQAISVALNTNDEKNAKCKSRLAHLFKKYKIPLK